MTMHDYDYDDDRDNETTAIERTEFGGRAIAPMRETATTAAAAQAEAAVKARYAMAMHRPRDFGQARQRLLKECRRKGFAEVARYRIPRGGKHIEGPSIRFAEAAARALGNIYTEAVTVYDDDEKRIVRITATDLEANMSYSVDATIEKTIERKTLTRGQRPRGQRINSYGDVVYLVQATEDDLASKAAARISKATRTCLLRLIDGDLIDEAMQACAETRSRADASDPDAARKRIEDAFGSLNIMPADLSRYLGCQVSQASPAQIAELRDIFTAIREGHTTWRAVLDEQQAPARAEEAAGKGTEGAKEAMRARRQSRKQQDDHDPLTAPPDVATSDDGDLFAGRYDGE